MDPMSTETPEERAAHGRKARELVPRSKHGDWAPPADRPAPLEILALQATTRVPDLVPIRYGRMAASPLCDGERFAADLTEMLQGL